MEKRVVVAMSGGVDSSVAAYLLKEKGYDVIGITLNLWDSVYRQDGVCCGFSGIEDARKVAGKLGIRHYVLNAKKVFAKEIISYFAEEYLKGETPNPCAYCNSLIKFGYLLEKAKELSAKFIATGHYAKVSFNRQIKRYVLQKGADEKKDQSYFLSFLNQKQLSHAVFPLGDYTKDRVRNIARKISLPVAEKPQSQEICFIEDNDYAGFIKRVVGATSESGPIKDLSGKIIGRHKGLISYTIGQRKGLGVSYPVPLYVTKIVPEENTIYAADKEALYKKIFYAKSLNPVQWKKFPERFTCNVKIRYKNPESGCCGKLVGTDKIKIVLKQPQWAPAPGQLAVFYRRDIVLGAGVIETC